MVQSTVGTLSVVWLCRKKRNGIGWRFLFSTFPCYLVILHSPSRWHKDEMNPGRRAMAGSRTRTRTRTRTSHQQNQTQAQTQNQNQNQKTTKKSTCKYMYPTSVCGQSHYHMYSDQQMQMLDKLIVSFFALF